ncbi:MAG: hypothetical protein OEP95_11195 [Myxococcales bacterium]|nr:hypothetical protein [Myxococcales bacterium]
MSGGEHPHLRSVDAASESDAGSEAPQSEPTQSESSPARSWLVPALCIALLVCAGGWLWQARGAAELEAQLSATRAALARSELRVAALEGHLGSVRDRFATLQATLESELEALGGLLSTEPGSESPDAR